MPFGWVHASLVGACVCMPLVGCMPCLCVSVLVVMYLTTYVCIMDASLLLRACGCVLVGACLWVRACQCVHAFCRYIYIWHKTHLVVHTYGRCHQFSKRNKATVCYCITPDHTQGINALST